MGKCSRFDNGTDFHLSSNDPLIFYINGLLPISPEVFEKMHTDKRITAFHVLTPFSADDFVDNVNHKTGNKGQVSCFTRCYSLHALIGNLYDYEYKYYLGLYSGIRTIHAKTDIFSVVDDNCRRWIDFTQWNTYRMDKNVLEKIKQIRDAISKKILKIIELVTKESVEGFDISEITDIDVTPENYNLILKLMNEWVSVFYKSIDFEEIIDNIGVKEYDEVVLHDLKPIAMGLINDGMFIYSENKLEDNIFSALKYYNSFVAEHTEYEKMYSKKGNGEFNNIVSHYKVGV